jgi:hypothetical protein
MSSWLTVDFFRHALLLDTLDLIAHGRPDINNCTFFTLFSFIPGTILAQARITCFAVY